ncbi:MAG: hypothetical protein ACRDT6_17370 [Micromonosporaceae bacterium]
MSEQTTSTDVAEPVKDDPNTPQDESLKSPTTGDEDDASTQGKGIS